MVAFVIFWSAILAAVCFLIGTLCNLLSSVIEGGIVTAARTAAVAFLGGLAAFALYLIYSVVASIIAGTFWDTLLHMGLIVIAILFVGGIILRFGALIFEIIVLVVTAVINAVNGVLEKVSEWCEMAYLHFLNVIIARLDQC